MVCGATSSAQVNKGAIVLGGNISYEDQSPGNIAPPAVYTYRSLDINPSVGNAIRNSLVLGINVSYVHGSNGSVSGGQSQQSNVNNDFYAGYSNSSSETPVYRGDRLQIERLHGILSNIPRHCLCPESSLANRGGTPEFLRHRLFA